mmetsp:Transcript_3038/g.3617  ORF Transcript_3038/g.3617 Transcript_3038/m.3617 type:complete len:356 (+) Transcript_3038:250-1317(+)
MASVKSKSIAEVTDNLEEKTDSLDIETEVKLFPSSSKAENGADLIPHSFLIDDVTFTANVFHQGQDCEVDNPSLIPLELDRNHPGDEPDLITSKNVCCMFHCFHIRPCGCCSNRNVRILWILLVANTSFTIAQFVGAYVADSLSMLGDSSTMALDSFTYMLNIYAEKKKTVGTIKTARLEVYVASFSVFTLILVTAFLLWDAISRLVSSKTENVRADIMLNFSVANLVVDIISCGMFSVKFLKNEEEPTADTCQDDVSKRKNSKDSDALASSETDLNMASAFVHLVADTLRTITVMVTAIVVDVDSKDVNSKDADAVSSIIVSIIILFVAGFLIKETCQQYRRIQAHVYEQVQST